MADEADIWFSKAKRFTEKVIKNIIRVTERQAKAYSKVKTGRAQSAIIIGIGQPDDRDPHEGRSTISQNRLAAQQARGKLRNYTLEQGDPHVSSRIYYGAIAYRDGAFQRAILDGHASGSTTKQGR